MFRTGFIILVLHTAESGSQPHPWDSPAAKFTAGSQTEPERSSIWCATSGLGTPNAVQMGSPGANAARQCLRACTAWDSISPFTTCGKDIKCY